MRDNDPCGPSPVTGFVSRLVASTICLTVLGCAQCSAKESDSSAHPVVTDVRVELLPGLSSCYRIWVSPNARFVGGQLFPDVAPDPLGGVPTPRWGSRAKLYEFRDACYEVLDRESGELRQDEGILIAPPDDEGATCRVVAGDAPRVLGSKGRQFELPFPNGTKPIHVLADLTCERFVVQIVETRHNGRDYLIGLDASGKTLWQNDQHASQVALAPDGTVVAVVYGLPVSGEPDAALLMHEGIVVLDADTGERKRSIDLDELLCKHVRQLDFSRDGRQLIALSNTCLMVVDVDGGSPRVMSPHPASSYAISGDGYGRVLALFETGAAVDSFAMHGMSSASLCGIQELDSRNGNQGPLLDSRLSGRCPNAIEYGPNGVILVPSNR